MCRSRWKMYGRKIKLIRVLVENERLSSAELMKKLQISQRTLREEIREINDVLEKENVYIRSLSVGGYYIKEEEKEAVQRQLDRMICQSRQAVFPETPDERLLFGFAWLFFQKEPVSIQKAAEKLYVSRTAMLQTKKQIQDTIRWYHDIYLESGPRGMWISGKEEVRRHVLAEIINYWTYGSILVERVITFLFGPEKYIQYRDFYHALPGMLAAHGYRLIDKAIEGFSLDVFISLMRCEYGFELDETGGYCGNSCVETICGYLEEMGYRISDREKAYFERCLTDKRVFYTRETEDRAEPEYVAITEEFLEETDKKYETDYHKNQELIHKLSVHIMKMIRRIRQGYFETNTILKDIMDRYEREVEMADGINPILQKQYGITANIHEICYLAVYLRAYLSRTLQAVVLCDLGEGIADNMVRQIKSYCGEKIRILDKMSLAEYRIRPLPVDLLISGSRIHHVELPQKTKIIYVDYLLREEDLKNIQEFLLRSKEKNAEKE